MSSVLWANWEKEAGGLIVLGVHFDYNLFFSMGWDLFILFGSISLDLWISPGVGRQLAGFPEWRKIYRHGFGWDGCLLLLNTFKQLVFSLVSLCPL